MPLAKQWETDAMCVTEKKIKNRFAQWPCLHMGPTSILWLLRHVNKYFKYCFLNFILKFMVWDP